ncbi:MULTISPECIES: hypothetical protein [Pseudomonas]|uniref:Uncharacterized protein n=1 Tax=Pseudomonas mandelii TaxID=75612 RepID=A0AB36CXD4_9PSED|nr:MULTISPECIES: hypothetical protein [Pseudomonas]MBU0524876.1 hypothetical protein [Gammaproteobacteria bacterium]MBU0817856.1 hypothetical protein [Gammaproteobacteria bacterium]MBU0841484.1 hypothetical protein [Gammaproteobacteria bacterium]MBU1844259.1 hypothetical protein [Gammaproteobacteria bacterium]MSU97102.1 hypothetical protein [Pseudomonas mandelii]
MKISALCATGSLLVSTAVSATGIIPVLDLDFTRPAVETLKKIGINDACIIAASNPAAFTYCREGSSTLWKYQALDLEQQASILKGEQRPATDFGRITVVEVDSAACLEDTPAPLIKPAITRGLALGVILLFLLIGFRYTYRAIMPLRDDHKVLSDASLQRLTGYLPAKALGAFGIAAAVTLVYCFW